MYGPLSQTPDGPKAPRFSIASFQRQHRNLQGSPHSGEALGDANHSSDGSRPILYGNPTNNGSYSSSVSQHAGIGNSESQHDSAPGDRLIQRPHGGTSHEKTSKRKPRPGILSSLHAWTNEIIAILFASLLFTAIVVVLKSFDGKKTPSWGQAITLNSLIAILATIFRASLMTVVEEVISQLKWSWFRLPRPLNHLTAFDQGSRGPLGSAGLLFTMRRPNLASIGSCLTILSLAIAPFAQQTIKPVACEFTSSNVAASVPIAKFVAANQIFRIRAGGWELDYPMQGAIISSLSNPGNDIFAIVPECASGNCTFPEYRQIQEVAASNKWMNASTPSDFWVPMLPNNLTLQTPATTPNVETNYTRITTGNFDWVASAFDDDIIQSSIANISVLTWTANGCSAREAKKNESMFARSFGYFDCPRPELNRTRLTSSANVVAAACTLYPCLKHYHGTVDKGTLQEKVVDTTPVKFMGPRSNDNFLRFTQNDMAVINPHCILNDTLYTMANMSQAPSSEPRRQIELQGENHTVPARCVYALKFLHPFSMMLFFQSKMNGKCMYSTMYGRSKGSLVADYVSCSDSALASFYNRGNASVQTITDTINGVVTTVTNQMRAVGLDWDGRNNSAVSTQNARAFGISKEAAICVKIHWKWLQYPGILLAIAMLLLGTMIIRTMVTASRPDHTPVWKSSVLPLVFYGFGAKSSTAVHEDQPLALRKLQQESRSMTVRLGRDGERWGLVEASKNGAPIR